MVPLLLFNIKSLIRNSVPLLGFLHNRDVDVYTIGEVGGWICTL